MVQNLFTVTFRPTVFILMYHIKCVIPSLMLCIIRPTLVKLYLSGKAYHLYTNLCKTGVSVFHMAEHEVQLHLMGPTLCTTPMCEGCLEYSQLLAPVQSSSCHSKHIHIDLICPLPPSSGKAWWCVRKAIVCAFTDLPDGWKHILWQTSQPKLSYELSLVGEFLALHVLVRIRDSSF